MTRRRGAGSLRSCLKLLRQRRRFLLWALAGSVGLWLILAKLVVPSVIRSAYRGESLPFFNRLIRWPGRYSVESYLGRWDQVGVTVLSVILVVALVTAVTIWPSLYRRYVGRATPGTLGAIRALVCGIALCSAWWEDLASSARLPGEMRSHEGVLKFFYYLPGFEAFLSSETALRVFEALTVLVLFLGVIGWRTRIVVPLGAFCALLFGGIIRQYTWFFHAGLVPILVMTVLALTPCGDGWSVDRLLRISRGRRVPAADRALSVYGWSRFICWLVVSLAYFEAGLSKLGNDGIAWFDGERLKRVMLSDSLQPMEFNWALSFHFTEAPNWFFSSLAAATVIGELAFILVPFFPVARLIVPAAMVMMHVGILVFQNVLFPDLIGLQLMFYNFIPAREAIGRWLRRRRGHLEVLYDGRCPLCRRTVKLLAALDLFARLEVIDFRRFDLADYNRRHGLQLKPEGLAREMQVVSRHGVDAGFYAFRTLSCALPALWPVVPLLYLPGAGRIGKLVYGHVARNRMTLFTCNEECPIESPEPIPEAAIGAPAAGPRYRWAVSAIAGIMLICWALRIEFYPLTAMQMYTKWGPVVPITYYKAIGRYESGETSRAPLEEAIGAMADSRYRRVIEGAFRPARVEVCRKYLAAVASAYNRRATPGKRLKELEIQKWTWDFMSYPSDRSRGALVDRFVFAITDNPQR